MNLTHTISPIILFQIPSAVPPLLNRASKIISYYEQTPQRLGKNQKKNSIYRYLILLSHSLAFERNYTRIEH